MTANELHKLILERDQARERVKELQDALETAKMLILGVSRYGTKWEYAVDRDDWEKIETALAGRNEPQ